MRSSAKRGSFSESQSDTAASFGISGRAVVQKSPIVTVRFVTHEPAESITATSIIKTTRFIFDLPHFLRGADVALEVA